VGGRAAARPVGAVRRIAVLVAALAWAPAATAAPLTVRASFNTTSVAFGGVVHTHVVVRFDPAVVRAGSIRVLDVGPPLTVLTRASTSQTSRSVTVERTAACLDRPCAAAKGDATPRLPPVRVTATARDGRTLRATATWPALHVHGRVTAADLARGRPPFRADLSTQPVSYSIAPSTLARLLVAAAIALALGALVLAALAVRATVLRRVAARPVDELARALRLAREAQTRPEPDRRRALGWVARLLGDAPLARRTSGLAWSRPAPQPEELSELVDDVERGVRA
jgi:hypothetical protein